MTIATKVGLVGLDNSHIDHFLRYLNEEQRFPGWRVTTVAGELSERSYDLCQRYDLEMVPEPRDLVGRIDAALLCDRDGGAHLDQAKPLLEAGLDLFVDKPLALSSADASEMVAIAMRTGSVLRTGSAFRYTEKAQAAAHRSERTPPQLVIITGPADRRSPYGGIFFYGIHHVELLLEVLGNPHVAAEAIALDSVSHHETHVIVGSIGPTTFILNFVDPEVQTVFRAQIGFGSDVMDIDLGREKVSYAPLLDQFVAACTARGPASSAELVLPVVLLERIAAII